MKLPLKYVKSLAPPLGRTAQVDWTNRINNSSAALAAVISGDGRQGNDQRLGVISVSEPRWFVTFNGTISDDMDSNLGAVGVAQSFGNFHLASNLTPNPLNIIWHTGTMACLLRQKAVVFKTSGVIRNGQSTYNASITTSSGNLRFIKDGSGGTPTNITSSIPLVTGAPYFIAVSWDDAVAVNFVVRRMDTGQLYSETQADTTAMALTSDGLPIAETNGGNLLNVAALAFSTVNLARYELINMAADPWSLWYADGDEQFVGMIPAATIKFRKTLSQVGTRIGARQIQGWSQ